MSNDRRASPPSPGITESRLSVLNCVHAWTSSVWSVGDTPWMSWQLAAANSAQKPPVHPRPGWVRLSTRRAVRCAPMTRSGYARSGTSGLRSHGAAYR
eukprot:scaffold121767_cov66-Phaeocystis_antarctica.AAC.4